MVLYTLRRLVLIVLLLGVMSVLLFAITQVLPGNVARMILGQFATPDAIEAVETRLGLKDPLVIQYGRWFFGIVRGDFGQSLIMERPIGPVLAEALGRSAVLAALSFVLVASVGILLGVIAAVRKNRPIDHAVSVFSYLGISVPEFFWGIAFILVFARWLGWLPSAGYSPIGEGFGNWFARLIGPTLTLTFTLIAHVSRLTRSSMLETLRSRYVLAARAKGLPERVILFRHALRNALLPTITVLAIDVGWLFGGIVVVETVFAFPGLGRLVAFAIERRDLPLIQATLLVITAVYCLANLAADLLYAALNPRIRYARRTS
ncbi:MAG: ABC transporter permease [Desulfobacterales bacterium]